jgi:Tfp pilus assembly protein PilX
MAGLRSRLTDEGGQALVMAFFVLLAVLAFSGATFEATQLLSQTTNQQTNAQKAFEAADAGIDAAVHRIAIGSPTANQCVTDTSLATSPTVPSAAPVWCSTSASETVGNGASFSYSDSIQNSTATSTANCVTPSPTYVATAVDRCIVATGASNGVTRRVMARVTTQGGAGTKVFSDGSTKAVDSIKVESGVSITSDGVATLADGTVVKPDMIVNNKLEVNHGSTISMPIHVGPKARVTGLTSGAYTRDGFVPPSTPDFGTSSTPYDSNTNLGGNKNSTISSAYYTAGTQGQNNHRSLHIPRNKQVTLAPGIYNFCSIKIDDRGILNTAGTSANPVIIYLDSPARKTGQPSYCAKNGGTFTAGGKSVIVNPSLDPTALQIFAWGAGAKKARSRLQFPLGKNGVLAAIIEAPQSEIRFGAEKGTLIGGLLGNRIVFKKNMHYIADSRVANWSSSTIVQSFRVAWKQCSTVAAATTPNIGC